MHWTARLEVKTSAGEVKTTELVTFSRPVVVSTLAEIGLLLAETKALLARLQASMLCQRVASTWRTDEAWFQPVDSMLHGGGLWRCEVG